MTPVLPTRGSAETTQLPDALPDALLRLLWSLRFRPMQLLE